MRVMTSLLSFACPRTLTLLATTVALPATSGTVRNSGSFFLATAAFCAFFADFFFADLAAGALVAWVVFVPCVVAVAPAGFVTGWAARLNEIIPQKISHRFFFIA